MATTSKGLFADLSNEELKEKEKSLRSDIRRLGDAIEEEREELDRLKGRLRKGDRSVESQIEDVQETINDLQAERSKKRSRMETARRMRKKSGRSSSASRPSYGL